MPERGGPRHGDLALREEELARPEEEVRSEFLDLDEPRTREDESPFSPDDLDEEAGDGEEELAELAAGTDAAQTPGNPVAAIEIVKMEPGYTYHISSSLPQVAMHLDTGRSVRAYSTQGRKLRLERLQLIAEKFIDIFHDWLDHLDDPQRHRRLPVCEKQDFYKVWPEANEKNRATAIFPMLFIQLPNQEVIFLDDYLGKTANHDLNVKAVREELEHLLLANPGQDRKTLRGLLVESVRTWGPRDYDITEQGVRDMINRHVVVIET